VEGCIWALFLRLDITVEYVIDTKIGEPTYCGLYKFAVPAHGAVL
jgi:hypothetical protein